MDNIISMELGKLKEAFEKDKKEYMENCYRWIDEVSWIAGYSYGLNYVLTELEKIKQREKEKNLTNSELSSIPFTQEQVKDSSNNIEKTNKEKA